jgi:hypothetical protein
MPSARAGRYPNCAIAALAARHFGRTMRWLDLCAGLSDRKL